jgi:uncharacterized protein involved in exopolysaccharide biosynthesis
VSGIGHSIGRVAAAAWRYRWTFAVPVATLLLPATVMAVRLPDTYRATALVQVRPPRPESITSALPQETEQRPDEVLATLRDGILAHDNVVRIAPLLHGGADGTGVEPKIVERLRQRVDYERVGSSAFTVSVEHVDPDAAARAVNLLLESFFDAERARLLGRAEAREAFHLGELEQAKKDMAASQAALDAFREQHRETLPAQKDAVGEELRQLAQRKGIQEAIASSARARLDAIEQMLIVDPTARRGTDPVPVTSAEVERLRTRLATQEAALGAAEKELAGVRARYTDRHPEVARVTQEVEGLRDQARTTELQLAQAQKRAQEVATGMRREDLDTYRRGLVMLRDEHRGALDRAEAEGAEIARRMDAIQHLLARMPETKEALEPLESAHARAGERMQRNERIAAEARQLTRHYRTAEAADVAGFRVDRWAAPPALPSGPGRWRWMATAVVAGLICGYGLLLLRRRSEGEIVRAPEDLAGLLPGALFVNVPLLGEGRTPPRRLFREAAIATWVVLAVATSGFAVAARKGWVDSPPWVRALLDPPAMEART